MTVNRTPTKSNENDHDCGTLPFLYLVTSFRLIAADRSTGELSTLWCCRH